MRAGCEAIEVDNRVLVHALTSINAEEELFIDYGPVIDAQITEEVRVQYVCHSAASARAANQ